jgi:Cytidylate kinase-like family
MGTVTIAATYGAGGSIIGPAVAKRLGLPFVDRAIPAALVRKIHEPLAAALADDSASHSEIGRLLNSALSYTGLFAGVPIGAEELGVTPDVAHTEVAIGRLAEAGGAVILGRAGVFVLKDRPDVLHVRLDGPVEARRRAAMEHESLDYKQAARNQQDIDSARRAYVSHFYPRAGAWEDPRHYHLVLDSTAISSDACVEIITRAARDLFARSKTATPQGQA